MASGSTSAPALAMAGVELETLQARSQILIAVLALVDVARSADAADADAAGAAEAAEALRAASLSDSRLQAFMAANYAPQVAVALLVRAPPVSPALKEALVHMIGSLVVGCTRGVHNPVLLPGIRTAPVASAYMMAALCGTESEEALGGACLVIIPTLDDDTWRAAFVASGALTRLLSIMDSDSVSHALAHSALGALTAFVWASMFSEAEHSASLVPWSALGRCALRTLVSVQRRTLEASLAPDAASFVAGGALSLLDAVSSEDSCEAESAAALADAVRDSSVATCLFPLILSAADAPPSAPPPPAPPPPADRKGKGKRKLDGTPAAARAGPDEDEDKTLAEAAVVSLASVLSCVRNTHPDAAAALRNMLLESGPVLEAIGTMYAAEREDASWASAGMLLDCAFPESAPHNSFRVAPLGGVGGGGGGAQCWAAHDAANAQLAAAWHGALDNLLGMGFCQHRARQALTEAHGNADRAAEILLGAL